MQVRVCVGRERRGRCDLFWIMFLIKLDESILIFNDFMIPMMP